MDDAATWSELSNVANDSTSDFPSSEIVYIVPGSFLMGSPIDEPFRFDEEVPHWVHLTGAFYLLKTEITNQAYSDAMQWAYDHGHLPAVSSSVREILDGTNVELLDLDESHCQIQFNDSVFSVKGEGYATHPIVAIPRCGAARYCDWMSMQSGYPRADDHNGQWACNGGDPYRAGGYRVPTESEWEYACRAGTTTPFNRGDCLDSNREANYLGSDLYVGCAPGEAWKCT